MILTMVHSLALTVLPAADTAGWVTPHMTSRSVRDLDPHLQLLSSLIDHVLKAVQRPWIHLYKKEVLVLVKVKPAKRLFL